MIWRLLEGREVLPKYLLNGAPKHGLHLLVMLAGGVCEALPRSIYNANAWAGTYRHNSFTHDWLETDLWSFLLARLQQGQYAKGHLGWRQDVSDFLRMSRMAHVFITRDLRDVAVSQAHHVLSASERLQHHPGKDMYRTIEYQDGFDGVLEAIITGIGPFPGVCDLFEAYAPWLEEEWVHHVKFEDALEDLEATAKGMLTYGIEQFTDGIWQDRFVVETALFDQAVSRMVAMASTKEASPTFRHGVAGDWETAFKDRHVELFKEHDRGQWLVQLGYEENEGW